MKYEIVPTSRYKKSLKRLSRHKDFNQRILEQVIDSLAAGKKLNAKHRDHQLKGAMSDFRECHVRSDILLVYQIVDSILILSLVDIGTHSSLFK